MRLIARLDVKNDSVIKGIHLEGLRKVGAPNVMASDYYQAGIDEIILMDAVASLYDRNNLFDVIRRACEEVFIPITIGGGLRSIEDIHRALDSGADKVAINTAAIHRPELITQAAETFGSQAVVGSIEAKRRGNNWYAYWDNGRESSEREVIPWAKQLQAHGVGEILITSIDAEGTRRGFDVELVSEVTRAVSVPVTACGGLGKLSNLDQLIRSSEPSAIACASVLHYRKCTVAELKAHLLSLGCQVRQ
ncbi:MAG: imidazole glycerol phosphate synthase subunit HisF [Gammaproteobacteria bacterium]|nr:imidazole glycerol phosphate synthase subunit HisF [Gammaproteobacteria bacterium]